MSVGVSKAKDVQLKSVAMATDFSAASYKALQHCAAFRRQDISFPGGG